MKILTRHFFLVSAMALSCSLCSSSVTAEETDIDSANALLPYCNYVGVDRPRGGYRGVGGGIVFRHNSWNCLCLR